MNRNEGRIPDIIEKIFAWGLILLLIGVAIFAAVFFLTMFRGVGVGNAMILVDPLKPEDQRISDPILGAAWVVKKPWVTDIHIYYATETFEDVIPCFSADQLEMQIEVLIRWSLDPDKIKNLYQNYPNLNYETKAIESIMEETIRLITKNYTALETIEQRDYVTHTIEQAVFKEIQEEPSLANALIHLEMDVKNIGYPPIYTAAIEEKLVSEQRKIQAEFEKSRIVILANATAQEITIKASAQAEAKVVIAQGTKQAIEMIIESSGTTNSTEIAKLYLWVETLRQIAPDIDLLLLGDAQALPILLPANQAVTSP